MEMNTTDVEPVTVTDILSMATWDRPRSSDELKSFIDRHESALAGSD